MHTFIVGFHCFTDDMQLYAQINLLTKEVQTYFVHLAKIRSFFSSADLEKVIYILFPQDLTIAIHFILLWAG